MLIVILHAQQTGLIKWKVLISIIKDFKRPVICTEYMARLLNSKFISHLPVFKT